jgi:hypothetical protein
MYHVLPSHVQTHGTTFDIMVTDVYTAWKNHKQNPADQTQYNTENLEQILKQTRGES